MKIFKVSVLVVMMFLVGYSVSNAQAATKASGNCCSDMKFGYVDINRALNEVEEGKKAKKALEVEVNVKKQKLAAYEQELKDMKTELEKKRLVLSPDALKEKEEEFRRKFMEVQQQMGQFQQDVAKKEMELTQGIVERLRALVQGIGGQDNYTMILETSRDVVLYAPAGSDLTDRVIKDFNSKKGKK
ncbi:MAG: OmpH family outer membrane protein [Pseudomonadota bacterium]